MFLCWSTNPSVLVDVPSASLLVFFPPLLLRGHLHLPQVYSLSPGGDVTDSHSQRPREQSGVWRKEATGEAVCWAQVRERDGAELPAWATGDGPAIWSVQAVIRHPPTPAPAPAFCRRLAPWSPRRQSPLVLQTFLIHLICTAACILLHPVHCGCVWFFRRTVVRPNISLWSQICLIWKNTRSSSRRGVTRSTLGRWWRMWRRVSCLCWCEQWWLFSRPKFTWMSWWDWRCASSSAVVLLCHVTEAGSAASHTTMALSCQNQTHTTTHSLCNEVHFWTQVQTGTDWSGRDSVTWDQTCAPQTPVSSDAQTPWWWKRGVEQLISDVQSKDSALTRTWYCWRLTVLEDRNLS